VGLSLAGPYLITWRTLWVLGSSHHGAGEKSLTKRTHMSVLLRVDKEGDRRPGPTAARRIGKLAAGSRRKPRSRRSGWQIRHDSIVRTLRGGHGEMVSQLIRHALISFAFVVASIAGGTLIHVAVIHDRLPLARSIQRAMRMTYLPVYRLAVVLKIATTIS
jgi:hypothetical protein